MQLRHYCPLARADFWSSGHPIKHAAPDGYMSQRPQTRNCEKIGLVLPAFLYVSV